MSKMSDWKKVSSEFEADGSLRDIYIFDTSIEDWDALLISILSSTFKIEYTHGDVKTKLPRSFEEVKSHQQTDPTTLKIYLPKDIQVNCHFFIEDEIEFDITPLEINSDTKYSELLSFMTYLREVLSRKVVLTHENSPDRVIGEIA